MSGRVTVAGGLIDYLTVNTMSGQVTADFALRGTGEHFVSLDTVIETMRQTGKDMNERYKETAMGGLAVTAVPVSRPDC